MESGKWVVSGEGQGFVWNMAGARIVGHVEEHTVEGMVSRTTVHGGYTHPLGE